MAEPQMSTRKAAFFRRTKSEPAVKKAVDAPSLSKTKSMFKIKAFTAFKLKAPRLFKSNKNKLLLTNAPLATPAEMPSPSETVVDSAFSRNDEAGSPAPTVVLHGSSSATLVQDMLEELVTPTAEDAVPERESMTPTDGEVQHEGDSAHREHEEPSHALPPTEEQQQPEEHQQQAQPQEGDTEVVMVEATRETAAAKEEAMEVVLDELVAEVGTKAPVEVEQAAPHQEGETEVVVAERTRGTAAAQEAALNVVLDDLVAEVEVEQVPSHQEGETEVVVAEGTQRAAKEEEEALQVVLDDLVAEVEVEQVAPLKVKEPATPLKLVLTTSPSLRKAHATLSITITTGWVKVAGSIVAVAAVAAAAGYYVAMRRRLTR